VERTDALLPGVGLEVAENHLLYEQPRLRRPARRASRRRRRRWRGLHGREGLVRSLGISKWSRGRPEREGHRSGITHPADGADPAPDIRRCRRRRCFPWARPEAGCAEERAGGGEILGKVEVAGMEMGIWGKFLGGKTERLGGFPPFVRCQTKINRKSVELGWTTCGPEVGLHMGLKLAYIWAMLPVMLGYTYTPCPYVYI
jgi:hypothetical protein